MEIWKELAINNNYEVSITGLIRVKSTGRILKPYHNKKNDKHLKIKLFVDNKRKAFFVHQLVASTFIKNICNYPEVNHIDHNPENNSITNLEWVDHKTNCQDAANFRKTKKLMENSNNFMLNKKMEIV